MDLPLPAPKLGATIAQAGTAQAWARAYVLGEDRDAKLRPPPPPPAWETSPEPLRIARPGRPPELVLTLRASKTPGREALRNPSRRAEVVHTFLHHELQAAELMCWALLAFPETPLAFRKGLLGIALDEVRHLGFYAEHLATLGHRYGDFAVRDWFWERVPRAPTAVHFVAVMGMGFEGGNLDHTLRFAERFRAAGDEAGAALQEKVCAEEIPHVRFAVRWFSTWTGGTGSADFAAWERHLPPPLSPMVMRGDPLNLADRARSGYPAAFLDTLGPMVPPSAWFLNFDSDDELARPLGYRPSPRVVRRFPEVTAQMRRLMLPGDVLLPVVPASLHSPGLHGRRFVGRAWCPTPRAVAAWKAAGVVVPRSPDLATLRAVNSRRFSAEVGQTLPGARYAFTLEEVEATIASAPGPWVLKGPFGFAGRGQRRTLAPLDEAARAWATTALAGGEGLQVEPWVPRLGDFGLHGYVAAHGKVVLGDPTTQTCDEKGVWRASRLAAEEELASEERAALFEEGERVASALFRAGYFGPFGVDAFRWHHGDPGERSRAAFNPRCEINARYSMGWALGMGQRRPDLDVEALAP